MLQYKYIYPTLTTSLWQTHFLILSCTQINNLLLNLRNNDACWSPSLCTQFNGNKVVQWSCPLSSRCEIRVPCLPSTVPLDCQWWWLCAPPEFVAPGGHQTCHCCHHSCLHHPWSKAYNTATKQINMAITGTPYHSPDSHKTYRHSHNRDTP